MKKPLLSLIVGLLINVTVSFAVDFNSDIAKFKVASKGCEKLSPKEVNSIINEVQVLKTRGFFNSISFKDNNGQMNFIFLFSDGMSQIGLPNYLATFTTLSGCQMFINDPEKYLNYLLSRQ